MNSFLRKFRPFAQASSADSIQKRFAEQAVAQSDLTQIKAGASAQFSLQLSTRTTTCGGLTPQ